MTILKNNIKLIIYSLIPVWHQQYNNNLCQSVICLIFPIFKKGVKLNI